MIRYLMLLPFIMATHLSDCQNRNSIWIFGDSAGINFSNVSNPTPYYSVMDGRGSCASICDTSGNLLFYSYNTTGLGDSATYVLNYFNDTLINGYKLCGQGLYNQITIIQKPLDSNKYYIFYLGTNVTEGLYYSIVDMSVNVGQGAIIQKNIQLKNNRQGDCLQAIKHANGRDWWILSKPSSNPITSINRFTIFLVTSAGISAPINYDFSNASDIDFQKIVINNRATKLMVINFKGFMAKYDFDRCTGIVSNQNIIFPQQPNGVRNFWEGAYSPNDSLFYATATWYSFPISDTSRLLQFNLFAADIPGSCDTLAFNKHPNIYGALRLGPDKKIYMANAYDWGFPTYPYPDSVYNQYNMNLGVINYPDSNGHSCSFQPFSFFLGGRRNYVGLPNNPNYQLGPVVGSVCDSLTSGITTSQFENSKLFTFYHHDWQIVFINAQGLEGRKYILNVVNILGHLIYKEEGNLDSHYYTHDLSMQGLADGVYIISLVTDKEALSAKFVRQ